MRILRLSVIMLVIVFSALRMQSGQRSFSQAYNWGSYICNESGCDANQENKPAEVGILSDVVAIDAGNSSSYALTSSGTVWAWGNNGDGQLGDGTLASSVSNPVQVHFPSGTDIVSIGEAENTGYAIDSTGQGWAWGFNHNGSLCLGNDTVQEAPVMVPGMTNALAVQGGQNHVVWLLSNGTLKACGENDFGQLGDGLLTDTSTAVTVLIQPGISLSNIVQISAGNQSSAALNSDGTVYMWGRNTSGQIGIGSITKRVELASQVDLPSPAVEVSAGGDYSSNGHSFALLNSGRLYAWGDDQDGQLGDSRTVTQRSPIQVNIPTGVTFVDVVAGGESSLALDSQGNVYSWGLGTYGALGTGKTHNETTPTEVDRGVDMISATANNAMDLHTFR